METFKNGSDVTEVRQFISFSVGKEEYGLELLRVKEVIRVREITRLPKAPRYVRGIINLRGDVIPIVDLKEKFGLAATSETSNSRIIVAEVDGRLVGMAVDSASQVVRIPVESIDPPPAGLGAAFQEVINGVGKIGTKLVILLNANAILGDETIDLSLASEAVLAGAAFEGANG